MSHTNTQPTEERQTKVSHVLVTQSKPADDKSPYFDLADKYNLTIDFRPFIQIQGVSYKEFRKQKINILDHTAIISRAGMPLIISSVSVWRHASTYLPI